MEPKMANWQHILYEEPALRRTGELGRLSTTRVLELRKVNPYHVAGTNVLFAEKPMTANEKIKTIVSSKEEISLPTTTLRQRHWKSGTRLTVEDAPQGVLLTAAPIFPVSRPEDVFGSLAYAGAPKTPKDMQVRVGREAKTKQRREPI
jgi:hypothetical protein